MYGIFAYIWLIFMGNVGKYTVRPMDPMGYLPCQIGGASHGSPGMIRIFRSYMRSVEKKPRILKITGHLWTYYWDVHGS